MTRQEISKILSLPILTLIPGVTWYWISSSDRVTQWLCEFDIAAFAGVSAAFAFTIMGFLTAILSAVIALSPSDAFARYDRNGYLKTFLVLYVVTAIVLTSLFVLSMVMFGTDSLLIFRIAQSLVVTGLFQFFAFTIIVMNLSMQRMREERGRKNSSTTEDKND